MFYFSAVAWQLSLSYPEKHTESKGSDGQLVDKKEDEGDLCILIFRSLISTDRPVFFYIPSVQDYLSTITLLFFFAFFFLLLCVFTNKSYEFCIN